MKAAAISLLDRLRYRSHSGRLIRQHRALRRLDFVIASWLHPVLLPLLFTVGYFALIGRVTGIWASTMTFWADKMQWPATFLSETKWLEGYPVFTICYPQIPGHLPNGLTLITAILIVLGVMAASFLLLRRRHLPLAYLCWALCLIQATAIIYFYYFAAGFPHSIASHVRSGLTMNCALVFLIPWILAPTFYPFAFPIADKLWITLLMELNIVVFTPLQYLAHAWAAQQFSLLVLPLLFTIFGLLLNIVQFVSIYAWAMSREPA